MPNRAADLHRGQAKHFQPHPKPRTPGSETNAPERIGTLTCTYFTQS